MPCVKPSRPPPPWRPTEAARTRGQPRSDAAVRRESTAMRSAQAAPASALVQRRGAPRLRDAVGEHVFRNFRRSVANDCESSVPSAGASSRLALRTSALHRPSFCSSTQRRDAHPQGSADPGLHHTAPEESAGRFRNFRNFRRGPALAGAGQVFRRKKGLEHLSRLLPKS